MRRLLVDVTRTRQSGLHTGIQRVVRRLLAALQAHGGGQSLPFEKKVQVLPVVFDGDNWVALPELAPHPLEGLVSQARPIAPPWPLQPGEGDTLLMADASWYLDPWPAVDAALARGARLVGLVHDLFPVQQPQWFRPGHEQCFVHHLQCLLARAALVLAPSQGVVQGLRTYLKTQPRSQTAAPSVLRQPLGADFLAANAQAAPMPVPVETDFYLSVGTLEPRKNHTQLLDAFDALWAGGCTSSLVLVGAPGWQVDSMLARIQSHPENGRRLHWTAQVSDPQLAALYRRARALVFLSLDEGFGLPVAEAFHLGCPVIAADIPVLREIGGDWPRHVRPDQLAELLRTSPPPLVRPDRPTSAMPPALVWAQVATQVLHKLQAEPPRQLPVHQPQPALA